MTHLVQSRSVLLIAALLIAMLSQAQEIEPQIAVLNAQVWTGNPAQKRAQALIVSGNRILAVGSNAEIHKLIKPSTRVIDAGGAMVTPGFVDAHLHFIDGGFRLMGVPLRDAHTREAFVERIREYAVRVAKRTWILGGDWDQTQWGGEMPARDWIDAVSPDNPVWVNRLDGHMALANSLALDLGRVKRSTKAPKGGEIVRDDDENPTGILKDNAMSLVERAVPKPTPEEMDQAIEAATHYLVSQGVTSVQNMGDWSDLEALERVHKAGKLKIRVYTAVQLSTWQDLRAKVKDEGTGDEWLRIGGLKGFVDGSLGSHTAAMYAPYNDDPENSGLYVNTVQDLYKWISGATDEGLHVMVHAIGDRANSTLLDVYEKVIAEQELATSGPQSPRFRIEHAQHLRPADIARMSKLGIIASVQPYHAIDDGRWAEKVIGAERAQTTYPFHSLLEAHIRLAFGSDWYVAPPDVMEGIYAAVTRATLDGKNPHGWIPNQKIGLDEALAAYTREAAYASFEEKEKGTLEPGKLADFVLLDRDLAKVKPAEIKDVKVRMTVIGGQVAYQNRE
jgi:predicted amidohydrolase YtcJ